MPIFDRGARTSTDARLINYQLLFLALGASTGGKVMARWEEPPSYKGGPIIKQTITFILEESHSSTPTTHLDLNVMNYADLLCWLRRTKGEHVLELGGLQDKQLDIEKLAEKLELSLLDLQAKQEKVWKRAKRLIDKERKEKDKSDKKRKLAVN